MQIAEIAVGFDIQFILTHRPRFETEVDKLSVVVHIGDGELFVIIDDKQPRDLSVAVFYLVESVTFFEEHVCLVAVLAVADGEHDVVVEINCLTF